MGRHISRSRRSIFYYLFVFSFVFTHRTIKFIQRSPTFYRKNLTTIELNGLNNIFNSILIVCIYNVNLKYIYCICEIPIYITLTIILTFIELLYLGAMFNTNVDEKYAKYFRRQCAHCSYLLLMPLQFSVHIIAANFWQKHQFFMQSSPISLDVVDKTIR